VWTSCFFAGIDRLAFKGGEIFLPFQYQVDISYQKSSWEALEENAPPTESLVAYG